MFRLLINDREILVENTATLEGLNYLLNADRNWIQGLNAGGGSYYDNRQFYISPFQGGSPSKNDTYASHGGWSHHPDFPAPLDSAYEVALSPNIQSFDPPPWTHPAGTALWVPTQETTITGMYLYVSALFRDPTVQEERLIAAAELDGPLTIR